MSKWQQCENEYFSHHDPFGDDDNEIIETCECCNKEFDALVSDAKCNHNFCSEECEEIGDKRHENKRK